ncbi:hypothetical protein V8F06_002270 [Rhypophila decipiens]
MRRCGLLIVGGRWWMKELEDEAGSGGRSMEEDRRDEFVLWVVIIFSSPFSSFWVSLLSEAGVSFYQGRSLVRYLGTRTCPSTYLALIIIKLGFGCLDLTLRQLTVLFVYCVNHKDVSGMLFLPHAPFRLLFLTSGTSYLLA